MGVTADHWPAAVIDSWLWTLEPSHFRVMFTLVALAAPAPTVHRSPAWGEVAVPAGGVVTSLDRLAERAGVTRAVVRGALDRLKAGPMRDGAEGAIAVVANPRGYTMITVAEAWRLAPTAQAQPRETVSVPSVGQQAPTTPAHDQHGKPHAHQHSGSAARTADSTAIVDGGNVSDQHSPPHTTSTATGTGDQLPLVGTIGALSDPRSQDPDPDQDLSVRDPADPPEPDDQPDEEPEDKAKARARRIPPRAWAGADYLRARILERFPENAVGRQPWGKDLQRGLRLKWADTIRLMNTADGRDFDEVARTIAWLFDPKASHLFVVLSAASLREKWDRIQIARSRQAQPAPARGADSKPSAFVNRPQRKEWT